MSLVEDYSSVILRGGSRCALDIGGTLAKIVYVRKDAGESLSPDEASTLDDNSGLFVVPSIPVGKEKHLHFKYFYSRNLHQLAKFMYENNLFLEDGALHVTGGGAYKYADYITRHLKVHLKKEDEIQSTMRGLHFVLSLKDSVLRFDEESGQRVPVDLAPHVYPFLLVNIGSGVSIMRANGPEDFLRVTGTCVGGGTVLGLARLIFGAKTFREVVQLSEKGTEILDLNVGDLFGEPGTPLLPKETLASSFGALYLMSLKDKNAANEKFVSKEDIARSLIHMVSYNIGYLAYLVGTIQNVHRIFFTGKYISNHSFTMQSITKGVNFYSSSYYKRVHSTPHLVTAEYEGEKALASISLPNSIAKYAYNGGFVGPDGSAGDSAQEKLTNTSIFHNEADFLVPNSGPFEALFLRHDGYLGAIGAFLASCTYPS